MNNLREKLLDLFIEAKRTDPEEVPFSEFLADFLIANGVIIAPAIPGPEDFDPNIMELCFRNGEQNMKEKLIAQLRIVAGSVPCITLAQAIKMVEDL